MARNDGSWKEKVRRWTGANLCLEKWRKSIGVQLKWRWWRWWRPTEWIVCLVYWHMRIVWDQKFCCHLVSKPILKKPTHVINACPEYFCFKCLYTILVCTFIPTKQIWSHKRLKWASPSPNKSNHSTRWSLKSLTCSTPKTGPISSGSNLALCSLKNNMMKTLNCKQAKYRSYFVILDMKTRLRWFTYS